MSRVVPGPVRKCRANPHCPNLATSSRVPTFALGAPGPDLVAECTLCDIFVCAECASLERTLLPSAGEPIPVWSLLCPRCGLALGAEDAGHALLHHAGHGVVAHPDRAGSGWRLGTRSGVDEGLAVASDAALEHLFTLGAALSVDEAIRIADMAIRESYDNRTALTAKALLCFKRGYQIAGARAVALLENAPKDDEPSVVDTILRAAGRNGLAKMTTKRIRRVLDSYQKGLDRAKRGFSPRLKQADGELQRYRTGKIRLAGFVEYLFPDGRTSPPTVAVWRRALELERSIDFSRVERERGSLVERLVATMRKEDVEQLIYKALGLRTGVLTYGSFYEYLAGQIAEYRLDITDLGELSRYMDYIARAQSTDSIAFHREVWEATWQKFTQCRPSATEWRLLREAESTYCLGRLLNVIEGRRPERINGTYAPNATALQALADKSPEGPDARRGKAKEGWLSRLTRRG